MNPRKHMYWNTVFMLKSVFSAFIFILIIGSLDEGFQKLLPYRVFEAKDILTNILSGILGMALFVSG